MIYRFYGDVAWNMYDLSDTTDWNIPDRYPEKRGCLANLIRTFRPCKIERVR